MPGSGSHVSDLAGAVILLFRSPIFCYVGLLWVVVPRKSLGKPEDYCDRCSAECWTGTSSEIPCSHWTTDDWVSSGDPIQHQDFSSDSNERSGAITVTCREIVNDGCNIPYILLSPLPLGSHLLDSANTQSHNTEIELWALSQFEGNSCVCVCRGPLLLHIWRALPSSRTEYE